MTSWTPSIACKSFVMGVRFPVRPKVGKLVVACRLVGSLQTLDQLYVPVSSAHKITRRDMTYTMC